MKTVLIGLLLISSQAFADVTIYTSDGCGPCQQAKQYLSQKGVSYNECNIANSECLNQYNKFGGGGTPLIRINGQTISGFSKSAVDRALGR